MKLLMCRACGDVFKLHPVPRTCQCGKSSGRYLDDLSTVEQTEGSLSLAFHNHDLRAAIDAYDASPTSWNPLMVLRAYVNPQCESDVVYAGKDN